MELAVELDEPPAVDDAVDHGGILAFILNEAVVVHRSGPMAGAIRRVAYVVSAAALASPWSCRPRRAQTSLRHQGAL